jgi:glutamate racemase
MSGKIGVIDSGVGGLTVVKEIMKQLPGEDIVYFGDTKRCPYGDRTEKEILRFTLEMIDFLSQFDLKAIVIACNTATVVALEEIRKIVSVPVIGVVNPGVEMALKKTKNKKVGVIGTTATIKSGSHARKIREKDAEIEVMALASPKLAPLIEKGETNDLGFQNALDEYIKPLLFKGIDTLILGCTHYPLAATKISNYVGKNVCLIDPAIETVQKLKMALNLTNKLERKPKGSYDFFVSGSSKETEWVAKKWLEREISIREIILN